MAARVMDFFESQDWARRKTGVLLFYYILAVIFIIIAVYAVSVLIFVYWGASQESLVKPSFWDPGLFITVAGITVLIIAGGTLHKVHQLSTGGKSVAELLGGRQVERDTTDPGEKKLLNIVEEMAIASGSQVPRIYMLDGEKGINAFAAGFSPDDAVIGVTRGCLENLSREELQGVIAHEFSHIINGDMRLNVKLMGVLFGILVIAFIGIMILRSSFYSSAYGRRSRSSREGGGGKLAIIVLGLALMLIGYIGVFFANLIKSAISRQREYLADASSVQYTRNPSGIAGALKKIGNFADGSKVENKHASEASHLFFSSNFTGFLNKLMSTHPPLDERIKKIDPSFEGKTGRSDSKAASPESRVAGFAAGSGGKFSVDPKRVVSSVGTTDSEYLSYASSLHRKMPGLLLRASHTKSGSQAVVYALLLSRDEDIKRNQIDMLKANTEKNVFNTVQDIASKIATLEAGYRLPILDMSIATLRDISLQQYGKFKEYVKKLVDADGKISLFEYTVQSMLLRHLQPAFGKPSSPKVNYRTIKQLAEELRLLLSMLANHGIDDETKKTAAFEKSAASLGISLQRGGLLPLSECDLKKFDLALEKINRAAPGIKKQIIDAAVSCVAADGHITVSQAELIRVTADAIGCPVPPLIPGKV